MRAAGRTPRGAPPSPPPPFPSPPRERAPGASRNVPHRAPLRLCHNSRENRAPTRKSRLSRRRHRACAEARGPAPASGQVALGGGESDGERWSGRAVGDGRGSGGPREAARRGSAGSSRCGAPRGAGRRWLVGPCPEAARFVGARAARGLRGQARSRRGRRGSGAACSLPAASGRPLAEAAEPRGSGAAVMPRRRAIPCWLVPFCSSFFKPFRLFAAAR